jgi:uncharacterized membrane protein
MQLGQILALFEEGALTPQQLAAVRAQGALAPDRTSWVGMASAVCAFGGALLLASGVIFFFAYNWADLHRMIKIAIATGGVLTSVGVAARSEPFQIVWRAALFGAALASGALLALIGQTYQTGADIWELFAAWALLSLPLTLLARSSLGALSWLVVANTALWLLLESHGLWQYEDNLFESVLSASAFNLLALAALEWLGARWLACPRRWVQRALVATVLTPLAFGASVEWFSSPSGPILLLSFWMLAIALIAFYRFVRCDLVNLALTAFAAIGVSTAGWVSLLHFSNGILLILPVYILITSGLVAGWILRLHRQGKGRYDA